MRDIKFRALTLEEKPIWMVIGLSFPWPKPHNSETVGQYTGLQSTNGVEIYEGDILEFLGRKGSIFWSDQGLWGVKWHNDNVLNWRLFAFYKTSGVEVIGNTYQNPELLKDVKE